MSLFRQLVLLVLILVAGVFLRIYKLGANAFWYDEVSSIVTANTVNLSSSFLDKCKEERNPPLFFLILKLFTSNSGIAEFMLRIIPATFGIISIIVVYWLGRLLFNSAVGLVSSFILALSPLHIYYSQELRAYTLLTVLSILSVYNFLVYLRLGKNRFLYIITTVLCLYTHVFSLFTLFAENLFFIVYLRKQKNSIRSWVIIQSIVLILFSPWIPVLLLQTINAKASQELLRWVPGVSFSTFMQNLNVFNLGYNPSTDIKLVSFVALSCLFVLGIFAAYRKYRYSAIFVLLWLFIPLLLVMLISIVMPVYLFRGLIYVSIPYYLGIAYGCCFILESGINKILRIFGFLIVLLTISLFSVATLKNYYSNIYPGYDFAFSSGIFPRKDIKGAVKYINEGLNDGDIVVHTCRCTYLPFFYYIKNKGVHRLIDKTTPVSYYTAYKNILSTVGMLPGNIGEFTKLHKRIWLINSSWNSQNTYYQLSDSDRNWLNDNCRLIEQKNFEGIEVYLYNIAEVKSN